MQTSLTAADKLRTNTIYNSKQTQPKLIDKKNKTTRNKDGKSFALPQIKAAVINKSDAIIEAETATDVQSSVNCKSENKNPVEENMFKPHLYTRDLRMYATRNSDITVPYANNDLNVSSTLPMNLTKQIHQSGTASLLTMGLSTTKLNFLGNEDSG